MEFISAKEFLKQDKDIQKVFIDWWKPERGDLVILKKYMNELNSVSLCTLNFSCISGVEEYPFYENDGSNYIIKTGQECEGRVTSHLAKDELIPLLTEGNLRKFIEDKTGGKIRIIELDGTNYNIISNFKNFINTDSYLLQAYWKVACQIATKED